MNYPRISDEWLDKMITDAARALHWDPHNVWKQDVYKALQDLQDERKVFGALLK